MIRRSTKILFELLIALLALAVILTGIAAWRLSQGPLQINFLTGYLERAITPADSEVELSIERTVLVWSSESQALDLRALGVRLNDRQGETVAILPWVSVVLSPRALLEGVVAPEAIEIYGARLALHRDPLTGAFSFLGDDTEEFIDLEPVPEQDAEESDFSALLPRILEVLIAPPGADQPLSYLEAVRIRSGRLIIITGQQASVWRIPFRLVELRRDRKGLAGVLALAPDVDDQWQGLRLTFQYDRRRALIDLSAVLQELQPAVVSQFVPATGPLSKIRVPISGGVTARLAADGRLLNMAFELTGQSGSLDLPDLLPDGLPIRGLQAVGRWDFAADKLDQLSAEIHLGREGTEGPVVSVTSSMSAEPQTRRLALRLNVSGFPAADLPIYWPITLEPEARDWVAENITDGDLETLDLTAALSLPDGDDGEVELISLAGGFRYRDLAVHYYRPLPPVIAVSGAATFDASKLVFKSHSGRLEDVQVANSEVAIVNLGRGDEAIEIKLAAQGPVNTVLRVLDWETLHLISDLGLHPAAVSGEASMEAGFDFPLLDDLTAAQIDYAAKAHITGAAITDLVFGWSVSDGDLSLDLDRSAMQIAGTTALEGLPISVQWRERLASGDGPKTAIEVTASHVEPADLEALGMGIGVYTKGPVAADVAVRLLNGDDGTLNATVDLTHGTLEVPELHWRKAANRPALLRFSSAFSGEGMVDIMGLELTGDDVLVTGRARLDGEARRLIWLDLDQVKFGRNRLTGLQARVEDEKLNLRVGGEVLDLQPYIGEDEGEGDSDGEEALEEGAKAWAELGLVANDLDRVILDEGHYLENVSLLLKRESAGWQRILLEGHVPEAFWRGQPAAGEDEGQTEDSSLGQFPRRTGNDGELSPEPQQQAADKGAQASDVDPTAVENRFSLDFGPGDSGDYRLHLTADDFGSLLRATGRKDPIVGGRIEVTGRSEGPLPGSTLYGQVEMVDYTLIRAPFLTKVLTIASLTGLWDTLQGRGIHFERLTGEFALTDGLLRSKLIRAYGPALGLTTKGEVDFYEDFLKISGTVVPAYTFNSILGEIPGLGPLLVGGEGEGLLAITYEAEGPIEDPEVDVNALSALAPGFLRGLLDGIDGYDGEQPTVFPSEREK